MQVHRRLVVYVQGYDPRGLPEYYRMFRREFRRTCDLYGLTGKVGRVEDNPERSSTSWNVSTQGDGWQVETRYLFLRWEDIIRKDFARPPWWKIVHMYRAVGAGVVNGGVRRIFGAHWRFGLFVLYPFVLMTLWLLLGAFVGTLCMKLIAGLGAPPLVANLVGMITGLGAFSSLLWLTEPKTYLLYLCDDIISSNQFALGQRPDWEKRMEFFAGTVIEAVRDSGADEAIVIGHSSGSFLAVDVVDRALARDPQLGKHGPRVRLLTIGANLPIIGFNPEAKAFRNRLRRLAVSSDIDWVDYQSRHDIMNFWPFDPITGHGIVLEDDERQNPRIVSVSFRDLWKENFGRRRWRFFRTHFQFLHANERLGAAYDYYLICCGPTDLVTRASQPELALAAVAPKSGPHPDTAAPC